MSNQGNISNKENDKFTRGIVFYDGTPMTSSISNKIDETWLEMCRKCRLLTSHNNNGCLECRARIEPLDKLDKILSTMAFKCAGGITQDGKREYTEAKQSILSLLDEEKTLAFQEGWHKGRYDATHQEITVRYK